MPQLDKTNINKLRQRYTKLSYQIKNEMDKIIPYGTVADINRGNQTITVTIVSTDLQEFRYTAITEGGNKISVDVDDIVNVHA